MILACSSPLFERPPPPLSLWSLKCFSFPGKALTLALLQFEEFAQMYSALVLSPLDPVWSVSLSMLRIILVGGQSGKLSPPSNIPKTHCSEESISTSPSGSWIKKRSHCFEKSLISPSCLYTVDGFLDPASSTIPPP